MRFNYKLLLVCTWSFTAIGDPTGYHQYPPPPPQSISTPGVPCSANSQCKPTECCKQGGTTGYPNCAPIGYDPWKCIQSPSLPYKCYKDEDCLYGGCCVAGGPSNPLGICRYDTHDCNKHKPRGPKSCSSSKECGPNGCCAYDPILRGYFCVNHSGVAGRGIIFPQTKSPAFPTPYPPPPGYVYPPSQLVSQHPKYPPYPPPPPQLKYTPYPPPAPTKYPPYPFPGPTKYPLYPSPTKYPLYPSPTKYPPYPPPLTPLPPNGVFPPYPPPPSGSYCLP